MLTMPVVEECKAWHDTATVVDRPFTAESLFKWCSANCQGEYSISIWFIEFEYEEDAVLFRLRWG